jgi:hypothetical protein
VNEYRALHRILLQAGFQCREGRHFVYIRQTPTGRVVVTLPRSPSDRRGFQNDRAAVRRALEKARISR